MCEDMCMHVRMFICMCIWRTGIRRCSDGAGSPRGALGVTELALRLCILVGGGLRLGL
jgi:hypothetical protein